MSLCLGHSGLEKHSCYKEAEVAIDDLGEGFRREHVKYIQSIEEGCACYRCREIVWEQLGEHGNRLGHWGPADLKCGRCGGIGNDPVLEVKLT